MRKRHLWKVLKSSIFLQSGDLDNNFISHYPPVNWHSYGKWSIYRWIPIKKVIFNSYVGLPVKMANTRHIIRPSNTVPQHWAKLRLLWWELWKPSQLYVQDCRNTHIVLWSGLSSSKDFVCVLWFFQRIFPVSHCSSCQCNSWAWHSFCIGLLFLLISPVLSSSFAGFASYSMLVKSRSLALRFSPNVVVTSPFFMVDYPFWMVKPSLIYQASKLFGAPRFFDG